jgi:hypothetical protein
VGVVKYLSVPSNFSAFGQKLLYSVDSADGDAASQALHVFALRHKMQVLNMPCVIAPRVSREAATMSMPRWRIMVLHNSARSPMRLRNIVSPPR